VHNWQGPLSPTMPLNMTMTSFFRFQRLCASNFGGISGSFFLWLKGSGTVYWREQFSLGTEWGGVCREKVGSRHYRRLAVGLEFPHSGV